MGDLGGDDALERWLASQGPETLDFALGRCPDVIGIVDRKLTLRYVNWTAAGLKREAILGWDVVDMVPPDYRELCRETYETVFRTGTASHFEVLYQNEGHILKWDTRVGPIVVDGEVIGLVTTNTDVTERRRAEADRDRFFSLSLDMLVVVDPEGRLKRLNPAFASTLGYEIAEVSDQFFIDLVHPEDRTDTLASFEEVVAGTPVTDFENRYRRKDGEYRALSWRATVDPITGLVYGVARDVTDQRATEMQLRHAQKLEAIGQLAGGIAHDFNNLMQAVLANTELAMLQPQTPHNIAEKLSAIEAAANRAASLTKQLLAFSRRQPLRRVPLDLNELVQSLLNMLRRLLPENIHIDLIQGHNLASVSADRTQLEQVMVNLCVNARDAMMRGGQLTIETENVLIDSHYSALHPWAQTGRYVLLSVTDTGIGMAPDVLERVFEPFFTTKALHHGTGLGLATVYGIVRQHDGMVHPYSEPNHGTCFKVYLPADARLAAHVGTKIEAPPPRGEETILVAEDEPAVRQAVVELLRQCGYRPLEASSGSDAVRILRSYPETVHLALLDMVMPDLDGPETWEQLRQERPNLRVLFASGYADGRHLSRLPPDAELLQKPFRTRELLRRIRLILDA